MSIGIRLKNNWSAAGPIDLMSSHRTERLLLFLALACRPPAGGGLTIFTPLEGGAKYVLCTVLRGSQCWRFFEMLAENRCVVGLWRREGVARRNAGSVREKEHRMSSFRPGP